MLADEVATKLGIILLFVRSLQSRVGLYFPPVTIIITITLTQILQLRTLAKALLVFICDHTGL